MNKEQQKIYERDVTNFLDYTNQNNEDYKKHKLKLIREKDLEKKKINLGIYIFLGLLTLSAVILYLGTEEKLSSSIFSNETLICEGDTLTCEKCPACPKCSNSCVCPKFPDEIELVIKNETE